MDFVLLGSFLDVHFSKRKYTERWGYLFHDRMLSKKYKMTELVTRVEHHRPFSGCLGESIAAIVSQWEPIGDIKATLRGLDRVRPN